MVNATYDGNALPPSVVPSAEGIIVGLPPIIAAAAELLVPKSIPIIFAMSCTSFVFGNNNFCRPKEPVVYGVT